MKHEVPLNIMSTSAVSNSLPGAECTFTLKRGYHRSDGKKSIVAGSGLYIYEDALWVYVLCVDDKIDYEHKITVVPYVKDELVNIPEGKHMLVSPVLVVNGTSYEIKQP